LLPRITVLPVVNAKQAGLPTEAAFGIQEKGIFDRSGES